jgi:hypothetical protein
MKSAIRSGRNGAIITCDARTEPALIRRGLIHPTDSTLTKDGIAALAELDAEDDAPITVVRRNPGYYTVTTPSGDYDVTNCPADSDMVRHGFPAGPRWMVTNPGQYSADGEFTTLADALTSIRDTERHQAKKRFKAGQRIVVANGTVQTVVKMADRIGAEPLRVEVEGGLQWIADDCEPYLEPKPVGCPFHRVPLAGGANAPVCPGGNGITEYGVFGGEGSLEVYDCAYSAANRAAKFATEDPDSEYSVHQVCAAHRDEKAATCPAF